MRFDFAYNTKTESLSINNRDYTQCAHLFLSNKMLWRYLEDDYNELDEEYRPIFRVETGFLIADKIVTKTYQYENALAKALCVFIHNIEKMKAPGAYYGSIYLNPKYFGRLVVGKNQLYGDVYLNQVNYTHMSKLSAIKELRQLTNLGLKEAKDICDAAEHMDIKIDQLKEVPTGTTYLSFSRKS